MYDSYSFYVHVSKLKTLQECVKGTSCWFANNPLVHKDRAYVVIEGQGDNLSLFNRRWEVLTTPIREIALKKSSMRRLLGKAKTALGNFGVAAKGFY